MTKSSNKDKMTMIFYKEKEEKMEEEIIDILMATYNTNIHFLKIQIDSILNQSYQNIHLIISDDKSTKKDIWKTLQEYQKKDNRIEIYKQTKNLGYLKNFEFLMQQSKAEYIMFSDHDDIWYEHKVKRSIEVLKEKKVDLVYTDAEQIDGQGCILQKSYTRYKNMPMLEGQNNILAFSRHIAIGCSQMFTKKIKEQMLPFTEDVMAHDWINTYLANKQNGVYYIDEPLFGYRLHGTNEFGGRNLSQNLAKWKQENGKSYKAYKKYRNERVIQTAYLNGAFMCITYRNKLNLEKDAKEEKTISYYKKLLNTKVVNSRLREYHMYLSFKEMGKRRVKEELLFHFPFISYFIYIFR